MHEARPTPSLVDDPAFLADLDALDDGLIDRSVPAPRRAAPPVAVPARAALAPAAVARFPLRNAADVPIVVQPDTRRPLLDLFPTASAAARLPQPLVREAMAAPNVARPVRATAPAIEQEPALPPRNDETFYGFAEPAFALEPDVRFLYHSTEHDRVAQQLVEGIARREGVIVLTAPTGMGKTLLCKALVEGQGAQIDRRTLTSVLLTPPPSVDDLVRTLLVDFGVVSRDDLAARTGEGGDPTEPLRAFLSSLAALQANAVVVFDEAQNAGSDVLLAVHALAAALPRTLQIVLVGQPALTRLLGRPELRAMLEHVALRLHVGPLAADEVAGYVLHRVHLAAASPRVEFDDGAMDRLYALSLGVPRIVNQICDRALTRAFAASATTIDGELVADAAEDLGLEMPAGPRDALRRVALLLAFVLLMGVGGSTAAWVFRDRVHAILATWNVTP